jgi:hypothetical protein
VRGGVTPPAPTPFLQQEATVTSLPLQRGQRFCIFPTSPLQRVFLRGIGYIAAITVEAEKCFGIYISI